MNTEESINEIREELKALRDYIVGVDSRLCGIEDAYLRRKLLEQDLKPIEEQIGAIYNIFGGDMKDNYLTKIKVQGLGNFLKELSGRVTTLEESKTHTYQKEKPKGTVPL